jgi:hypothetical protein
MARATDTRFPISLLSQLKEFLRHRHFRPDFLLSSVAIPVVP